MNIDLTQITLAVIALLSAILTGFVIPWLKKKVDVENGKLTETQTVLLRLAINTAVKAAEQLFNLEEGQRKKEYVITILKEQGYEVDQAAIDAAIEAAVLDLHEHLT
jgi:Na+-translocating ferredoxin:NAD+ oxidoreductase RnfG subunit